MAFPSALLTDDYPNTLKVHVDGRTRDGVYHSDKSGYNGVTERRMYYFCMPLWPEALFDNLDVDQQERLRQAGVTPNDWADYVMGAFIDGLDDEFDNWLDCVLSDADHEVDECIEWRG